MRARMEIGRVSRSIVLGAKDRRIRSRAGVRTLETGIDTPPSESRIMPATAEPSRVAPGVAGVAAWFVDDVADGGGVDCGGVPASAVVVSAVVVVVTAFVERPGTVTVVM